MFGFGCGNGYGNNCGGCNNIWSPCVIILIIAIFYYQGLLNTRNCKDNSARNALVLLFLFLLCSGCCGGNRGCNNYMPCYPQQMMCCAPTMKCCMPTMKCCRPAMKCCMPAMKCCCN